MGSLSCVARSASGAPPRSGSVGGARPLPLFGAGGTSLLAPWLWALAQLVGCPALFGTRAGLMTATSTRSDTRNRGCSDGSLMPRLSKLCGEARHLRTQLHRINQYGGITTAYKSKDSSITSYAHDAAGRWSTHTSGQQHCLPWRAAAARSDGGLDARYDRGIAGARRRTHTRSAARTTPSKRRPASSRPRGGSCPSPTASS